MDDANGDVLLLPLKRGQASGELVRSENQKPGLTGCTIYLDSRRDPEGDRIGVHKPLQS